jgi:hypothetical protein
MGRIVEPVVVAIATFLASSGGFWVYLRSRIEAKDKEESATNRLLMGLARDRILSLGFKYIDRGWITYDEYQNLKKYLIEPYYEMGGNGTAQHLMEAVERLEFRPSTASVPPEEKPAAIAATIKMAEAAITDPPMYARGQEEHGR